MSTQPDPEYVAALIAAKDCLHAVTDRLEAALDPERLVGLGVYLGGSMSPTRKPSGCLAEDS
jgi:hypothetical protein